MKKFFLFALFLSAYQLFAQDLKPVKWAFSISKNEKTQVYTLSALATIEDGWHVFAPEPGGDGLLIPTEVKITNQKGVQTIGSLTPARRPVTHDMDGIGMVNYYEGEINFTIEFTANQVNTLQGMASFQCCNDKMCLPPTDIPFSLKL